MISRAGFQTEAGPKFYTRLTAVTWNCNGTRWPIPDPLWTWAVIPGSSWACCMNASKMSIFFAIGYGVMPLCHIICTSTFYRGTSTGVNWVVCPKINILCIPLVQFPRKWYFHQFSISGCGWLRHQALRLG